MREVLLAALSLLLFELRLQGELFNAVEHICGISQEVYQLLSVILPSIV